MKWNFFNIKNKNYSANCFAEVAYTKCVCIIANYFQSLSNEACCYYDFQHIIVVSDLKAKDIVNGINSKRKLLEITAITVSDQKRRRGKKKVKNCHEQFTI